MFSRLGSLSVAGVLLVTVAACGAGGETSDASSGSVAAADEAFPFTFQNCGQSVTLQSVPERVFVLGNDPVSLIDAVGALDQVAFKAGDFPAEYYSAETNATIAAITEIGEGQNATGGVEITLEAIIDAGPDLVIGYETETVTRDGLAMADIPLYVMPTYCPEGTSDLLSESTYDTVYQQVEFFGELLGHPDAGVTAAEGLRQRVEAAEAQVEGAEPRTGATVFVPLGGGEMWAYGSASMAQRQLAAAGLENVYGDRDEFLIDLSPEVFADLDPDVIVLIHGEGTADQIRADFLAMPGAGELTAVQNDQVIVQLFSYTEPPNPLSVDGLERLVAGLDG